MGFDRNDAGQYEWVNAWVDSAKAETTFVVPPEPEPIAPAPSSAIAPIAHTLPDDQLMRDVAEIERARDTLAAIPLGSFPGKRQTQALTLVPSRTTDAVPVVIGGVLALVMLTVFGAAAAMTKLAR